MKRKKPRNLRLLVQKNLEAFRWVVGVVERQTGPIKRDLFGVADLLAYNNNQVALVQVTAVSNLASHRKKLTAWQESIPGKRWLGWGGRLLWLAIVRPDNTIWYESL